MGMWSGFAIGYIIALANVGYSKLASRYIARSANPLRTGILVLALTIVWGWILGYGCGYVVYSVGDLYEQIT
jgi:hypothetical protein